MFDQKPFFIHLLARSGSGFSYSKKVMSGIRIRSSRHTASETWCVGEGCATREHGHPGPAVPQGGPRHQSPRKGKQCLFFLFFLFFFLFFSISHQSELRTISCFISYLDLSKLKNNIYRFGWTHDRIFAFFEEKSKF